MITSLLLPLLVLLHVPVPAAAATIAAAKPGATIDLKTEEGLRAELDRLESRYEALNVTIGASVWEEQRPGSAAGAAARAARDEAYKQLAQLYADPKLAEILAYWTRRNTLTRDPTLTRRVILWNKTHHTGIITLESKLRTLQDDLAARIESERPQLDGRSMTRSELAAIVAENPDESARRKAWLALAGPPGAPFKIDLGKLIRLRAVACQPIKEHWFHDLIYHAQDLEPYWTFNMTEVLMKKTEPAWQELLATLKKTLGRQTLRPWDYDYALTKLAEQRGIPKILAARFPQGQAVPAARKLLSSLGFDLGKLPLVLEVAPHALPSSFLPVRIPSELKAIVNPPAGAPEIIPFYEEVFRMHAKALQAAFNGQASPMMKGYPWIPGGINAVYAEGIAAGFSEFLRDPVFLSRQMGLTKGEIETFLGHERDRRLLMIRRRLLSAAIEFTVYVNPDADLDDRYRDLSIKALGVEMSAGEASVWRTDPMLVSRPVHHQDLLLAESIGLVVHAQLTKRFGEERSGSRKAAEWLIERCYAPGESAVLQERLYKSIEGGFDFDALVKTLGPAGAPASSP